MSKQLLVFDASPLVHFSRAGRLSVLEDLVVGFECVTTKAVLDELRVGVAMHPALAAAMELPWMTVVSCDSLDVLIPFGWYMNRLGNSTRNVGESTVLAWAEVNSACAYVDDQVACNIGRTRGVTVHRTLQLVIAGYKSGLLTEDDAQALIRGLADVDARFPAEARNDLFEWARTRNPPLL